MVITKAQFTDKVVTGERITPAEVVWAYDNMPLFELSRLALIVKKRKSGSNVYYNKNFHIEPTNICRFNCKFCSYRRNVGDIDAREMTIEEIVSYAKERLRVTTTEIHLVGGVHPNHTIEHYEAIVSNLRALVGKGVAIKAFSAVEHIDIYKRSGLSFAEGLTRMVKAGMDTVTGGGAEIFASSIRSEICNDKATAEEWLEFHRVAHKMGIVSTATILYGHIESIADRVAHLDGLRNLQDETEGFTAFIPLKYRSANNLLSYAGESSIIDDAKMLAISRIFLDNFDHIKAYPPMYGAERTEMALLFGADDIDGTVNDTTDIYSEAGVEKKITTESQMQQLIRKNGFVPVERDTFYNMIK